MTLTIEQRRALEMLAAAPLGFTEAAFWTRGFSPTITSELVSAGYAVARLGSVRMGGRNVRVTRFVVTDAGRRAIGMA
jgi:hypothetical protein